MNYQSVSMETSYAEKSLADWGDHFTGELNNAQKKVNRQSTPGWILLSLAVVFLCVAIALPIDKTISWVLYAGTGLAVILGVVLLVGGGKTRKASTQSLSQAILQAIQQNDLDKEKFVKVLAGRTKGKVADDVLKIVDPDTLAIVKIGKRAELFFKQASTNEIKPMQINVNSSNGVINSVTVAGEADVDTFSGIAVDYLSHKAYVEGIAALGMVQMLYTQIAPPGGEFLFTFNATNPNMAEVSKSAMKIFSSFDVKPEMKSITEALVKRRVQSFLQLILAQQGEQQTGFDASLLDGSLDLNALRVRDDVFVDQCVNYIGECGKKFLMQGKSLEVMANIPVLTVLPYLVEGFQSQFFFPQGIEAVATLGNDTHPSLIEAVRNGSGNLRYNAAIALGFMNATDAKDDLEAILPGVIDPKELTGVCYALVRLGSPEHLDTIIKVLDDPLEDVRHAAAIALEHLTEALPEQVYLHHLNDANMLVRLRLTRKLGVQGTENMAIVNQLVQLMSDSSEDVRGAAVSTLGKLPPEVIYDRMVQLAENGSGHTRAGACEVLGNLSQPQVIPVLEGILKKSFDKDLQRTIISSLGELGAVDAAGQIAPFLSNDDLSNAAFWALLRISFKDKEAGMAPLRKGSQHRLKLLFLQSLHGDEQAKNQLKGMIGSGKEFMNMIQALEYVQILRDAVFETNLRQVLTYRQPTRFPGDRYVSYMALKALVHILIGREA